MMSLGNRTILVLIIVLALATGCQTAAPTQPAPATDTPLPTTTPPPSTPTPRPSPTADTGGRILFIGNSHTFMNDLPGMFAELVRCSGREVNVDWSARGGYTLEKHARDRQTRAKLDSADWDFVVLQENTRNLTIESLRNTQTVPAVHALEEEIRSQGAQTVLVLMWASTRAVDGDGLEQFAAEQAQVTAALRQLAGELDVLLAPVGPAWEESLRQRPELQLWGSDNQHASPAGTYLMACVLYTTIYRQSPVGLSCNADLPEETVLFLHQVVEEATELSVEH
jgi:hypothetical protein